MHRQLLWPFALLVSAVTAHAYADEGDINFDINSSFGVESLEETESVASGEVDTNTYYALDIGGLIQFFNVQAFIHAPLRVLSDDFRLRERDWDERSDYLRIAECARFDIMVAEGYAQRIDEDGRCASWTPDEAVGAASTGRSEFTYLSLRLAPIEEFSLGYGSLIFGYRGMLEEDEFRDGVTAEVNLNRYLIFSGALSDVLNPTVTAGRVALRPVQTTSTTAGDMVMMYDDYTEELWMEEVGGEERSAFVEFGATAAADLQAPSYRATDTGYQLEEHQLVAGGVDGRIRWDMSRTQGSWDDYRIVRLELGGEYNQISEFDGGGHGHLRFYYDRAWIDLFVDAEYRYIGGQYMPRYFDQHYGVQRNQYRLSTEQREGTDVAQRLQTKYDFLSSLPQESTQGFAMTSRFRFWRPEGEDTYVPWAYLTFFAEALPDRAEANRAGVEASLIRIAGEYDVNATYVQQGWNDLKGLFNTSQSILELEGIYYLTEVYFTLYYQQAWFLVGEEYETTNNVGLNIGFYQ